MRTSIPVVLAASLAILPACSKTESSEGAPPTPAASDSSPRRAVPASASASAAPVASASAAVPEAAAPPSARPEPDVLKTSAGDLRVQPIHHGSVLFEFGGKSYYVDPFHEGNLDGLPPADVIFLSHPHPDHLDPAAIAKLKKPGTIFVCPPSVAEKLPEDVQRAKANLIVMKNGDKRKVEGVGVEAIPMYNLKRGPAAGKLFHEKGWGDGFVLTFGDKRVYLSGDTECTPEMKALKSIDVAFVCMNLPYTMPPSEAGACVEAFKPKILYPYHYRGSDLGELDKALAGDKAIEVRKRDWY